MAGSIFGKNFQVTTWGESHGKGIGVVVDGCPAGLPLDEGKIQKYLNRRKPGQTRYSTPRKENDEVEILSGVFEGRTTGTPISMIVYNTSQRSRDYSEIAQYFRPGHADYTFDQKYGFRDYRGGGRSSGRETIGRVAAGAIACAILEELGISVLAYTQAIGGIAIDRSKAKEENIMKSPLYMPDLEASGQAEILLESKMKEQDSAGGIIECIIRGVPAGVGEPVFEKLDANLSKAIMSIGAIKGVEIGDGFAVADTFGSQNNDAFAIAEDGSVCKKTNHAGGILGGISDGSDIVLRAAVKPTPSIARSQKTVNKDGQEIDVEIKGRHDPVIVPRAVVVVESMAAITVLDMLLSSMTSNMEAIKRFFQS
ncbi:MAG: chorismate synthase [Butyribacter sp.]|nr:chorismate synthase [bacterium]MDY3854047.1 chorismate synthase [Butyribacter sp.]